MEGSSDWFLRTNFFSREKALVTGSVFTSIGYWRDGKTKWEQTWWTFSRNEGKSSRFLRRKPEFSQSFKYASTLNLMFSVPSETFKLGDTLSCAVRQDIWVRKLTPPYFCRQSSYKGPSPQLLSGDSLLHPAHVSRSTTKINGRECWHDY